MAKPNDCENYVRMLEGFPNEAQAEFCVVQEFVEGCGNLQMLVEEVKQKDVLFDENDVWAILI